MIEKFGKYYIDLNIYKLKKMVNTRVVPLHYSKLTD